MKTNNIKAVSREEGFVNKLKGIVLDNLKNEQFGVEDLSKESGYSQSSLM